MEGIRGERYKEIARKVRELPPDKHISSHEWEELVQRLCSSHDGGLQTIGTRERNKMLQEQIKTS
jgi:hypothetical protein